MVPLTLVDATDLISWAARRDAQELLPRLIRRLAHATVDRINRIGFPAGEGIQAGGWDGILVVEQGNAFIPDGSSVWEFSTNHDVRTKASGDYEKRKNDPRGIDPAQATFIFVTPRRWGGKDEWGREKRAEGFWRDVRAYDADDIEQWLELAPAVHIWLSTLLGKHPEGTTDLESFWADWSEMTRPAITANLVLAGRGETVERVHGWLRNPSAPFSLHAESPQEALAVFAATLLHLPPEDRVTHFARAVVVHDAAAWNRLVRSEKSLVLIPTFDSRNLVARAIRNNHRVVLPLGRADNPSDGTTIIPRLSSQEAAGALVASGISEERANDLAILARRSLTAFRRKLGISPELQQPEWARPSEARRLLPAMLAGSWSDAVEGDCQALAKLAGAPYQETQQVLIRWANEADPPIRHVGNTWYINSKEDMSLLLERYLVRDDVDRFGEVVLDVLSTIDPQFETAEGTGSRVKKLMQAPKYSSLFRKGLAETLAVMGSRGETPISTGVSTRNYATRIVGQLLNRANADWRIWASLGRTLPLLAEAAPDAFLAAVDEGLNGNESVLLKVFQEEEDFFTSSPHIWLLWALETLAWSPEHLGRAALALAKLARLDPGGKTGNRPKNSLREIFLLWHPQTTATLEQRLEVLDIIHTHEPEVAWQILLNLRPVMHGVAHNTARPRWQEWVPDPLPQVSYGEVDQGVRELISRMLTDAGQNGPRWKDLIEALPSLPLEQYQTVTERLAHIDVEHLPRSDRNNIRDALRKLISQHRSFPDADWALPPEQVDHLDGIYRRFEPPELSSRYGWLFDDRPDLPEGRARGWRERQEAIAEARLDAARSLYDQDGVIGILDFCKGIKEPGQLGFTLGRSDLLEDEEDNLLRDLLASEDAVIAQFAHGFSAGRIATRGRGWGEEKLERLAAVLRPLQRAEILICLPHDGGTWDRVEGSDPEVEHRYWSVVTPYEVSSPADLERVVRKLIKYGRPYDAADLIVFYGVDKNPSPKLIQDVLSGILQDPSVKPRMALSLHSISELLNILEKSSEVEETRVAALEWAFLPLLGHYDRSPRLLHRELARNPDFFAEIVALAYRSENEEPHESTEEGRERALRAYELLDSWNTVPGRRDDGSIDKDLLDNWVVRARTTTSATGRGTIGDRMIGQVFSGSPAGADGTWPHPAVRDLIEAIASPELERGFELGVYNNRGVVTKKPTEGGRQERQLAERYTGLVIPISARWPRTAAMLRRIADSYHSEARREDQEAELREDLG